VLVRRIRVGEFGLECFGAGSAVLQADDESERLAAARSMALMSSWERGTPARLSWYLADRSRINTSCCPV
jgi:hypothetical protein